MSRILRLEGLILLIASVAIYVVLGGSWLMFAVLLFAPDVSLLGYLKNPRVGALMYNAVHAYLLPGALLLVALAANATIPLQIAVIWFAHIGLDRMLGYGLKYPTEAKATHIQRV